MAQVTWPDTIQLTKSAKTEFFGGDVHAGDTLLMGPQPGLRVVCMAFAFSLTAGSSATCVFKSSETATQVGPTIPLATATPLIVAPLNEAGWIQTPLGEGLILTVTGSGVTVGVTATTIYKSS